LEKKQVESSRKRRKLNNKKAEAFWKFGIGKKSTMYELDELLLYAIVVYFEIVDKKVFCNCTSIMLLCPNQVINH